MSSWDTTGRNADRWMIPPGESRVLGDIKGPDVTQKNGTLPLCGGIGK